VGQNPSIHKRIVVLEQEGLVSLYVPKDSLNPHESRQTSAIEVQKD